MNARATSDQISAWKEAREALASMQEINAQTSRFIQRVERGDPRVCNPGYENPNYFEKFGYAE